MPSSAIGSTYNWPWLSHVLSMSSTGGRDQCSLFFLERKKNVGFTFLFILIFNAPNIFIKKRVWSYSCYTSSVL